MSINKITYTDKQQLNANSSIQDINKVKATDMNEIKSVVNDNADLQGDLTTLETTEQSSLVEAINELGYYHTGESLTFTDMVQAGFLTTGKQQALFTITLPKSMANVSVSITGFVAQIRNNNNYILGTGSSKSAPSSINVTKTSDYHLKIACNLASATSGAVNNDACGFAFDCTINFS